MKRFGLLVWLLAGLTIGLGAGSARAQDAAGALTIMVSSPAEGEIFYTAAEGFRVSMPISGQVISYSAPLHPETVEVTLDLVDVSGNHDSVVAPLDDRGYFSVRASMLSRDRPWPSDDPHVEMVCGECHRSNVELELPVDVTHLVISARAADGRFGQVTRNLSFDYGIPREMLVTVDGLPGENAAAQVSATTLIYQWRRRTFFGAAVDGQAALAVEGLAHADLVYDVTLNPFVVDETLYTASPEQIVVPAGQNAPPVSLVAHAVRGSIAGRVVDSQAKAVAGASVLAVNLTTGAALTTTSDQEGRFTLDDMPVAEHVLLARRPDGFHLPQRLDLLAAPAAETVIHLTPAGTDVLQGKILFDDHPLPFAQATVAGLPAAHADPLTGAFELDAVAGMLEVEIAAAGCYGVRLNTSERDLGAIKLALRSDTRVINHDGWQLYLPATTTIIEQGGVYDLRSGVFWVIGDEAAVTSEFQVGAFSLQGQGAHFAVEKTADAPPRLYVSQGEVRVERGAGGEPLTVAAGQTLVLAGEPARPADLIPGAGALLRTTAGSVSRFELAPSTAAQQSAALSRLVVVAAQVFMLLALLISFVILPGVLVGGGVIYLFRHRRT